MGSLVGGSSLVPGTCLGPGNHSFAFGAPSPAGKELVLFGVTEKKNCRPSGGDIFLQISKFSALRAAKKRENDLKHHT